MPLQIIRENLYKTDETAIERPQIAYMSPFGCDEPKYDFAQVLIIDTPQKLTEKLARDLYVQKLEYALAHKLKAVALPLIRPNRKMLRLAVDVISTFLEKHDTFVCLCIPEEVKRITNKDRLRSLKSFFRRDPSCKVLCERDLEYAEIQRKMDESTRNCYPGTMSFARSPVDIARLRRKDKSFREKLFDWIDKKGMTDVACYKKANVDRRTFSKIKNIKDYSPSKQTAVAFAIALELDLNDTLDLLEPLGITLSRYYTFDVIIRYCIEEKIYDVHEINEILYDYDEPLLGYY